MSDYCLQGINWGNVNIDEKNLTFHNKQKNIFKFPIKKI